MKHFKTRLGLAMLLVLALIIVLSGWGLAINRSSIKQVAEANKNLAEKLKSSESGSTSLQNSAPTQTQPPTTSTTNQTSSKPTSPKTTPPPQTACTPTDSAKSQANSDIQAIHGELEAFYTDKGYYPYDISYSNFSSYGADANIFNPPPCIHFSYLPSPSGCTTAAQNCQHYTLDALDPNNNPVTPQQKSIY